MSATGIDPQNVFFCGKRKAWVARALAYDGDGGLWEFWTCSGAKGSIVAQKQDSYGRVSLERLWPRWEARLRVTDKSPWHQEIKYAIMEVLSGFPSLSPVPSEPMIDQVMRRNTRVMEENEATRRRLHARP